MSVPGVPASEARSWHLMARYGRSPHENAMKLSIPAHPARGLWPNPCSIAQGTTTLGDVDSIDETIVDDRRSGKLEAFTEIRLTGSTETSEVEALVTQIPGAQQFYAISGDPDVLIHLRVRDVDDLQRVVNGLRRSGKVAGTKTLIVLTSWQCAS